MKKRTYKRLQNRLYREIVARTHAQNEIDFQKGRVAHAENEAKQLRKRFAQFGTNVETEDLHGGVECVKWTLEHKAYGQYIMFTEDVKEDTLWRIKEELVKGLARGLLEGNFVQFVYKGTRNSPNPLTELGTLGAKLYVVPWEQIPHGRTIELAQLAKKNAEDTITCFTNQESTDGSVNPVEPK